MITAHDGLRVYSRRKNLQNVTLVTETLCRFLATSSSTLEVVMKSILMFLALGFALFAAPAAVTYPQQSGSQQSVS
jgi:hypothetical protein